MAKTLFSCVLRQLGVAPLFQISLSTLGYLFLTSDVSLAQVTSDGTVNTQVNQNGNVAEITGGQTRGSNLFHSFRDFSVSTGDTASFLNANDIANIFSRVTGGNISNIDGLIRANGSANLFLINPAGILFGENARLDVGGSFYGSTASSILFEDGEFSATDLENPPVLTVNAPIGLNLRDNPEEIINRSAVQDSAGEFVGLEVLPGNNLAFVGGNIKFEAGEATARGGNIDLGGLSAAGTVGINKDGSLSFPETVAQADISLINASEVDVRGTGGGNITVNARNLKLEAGEFDGSIISSFLQAGITADSTSAEAQAGDITINATGEVALSGESSLINQVLENGTGTSGNINIQASSLKLKDVGIISTTTFGQGNSGNIKIDTTDNVAVDQSLISSRVGDTAEGNGGDIEISTGNLSISSGSINTSTLGRGNAGNIKVNATDNLAVNGFGGIASAVAENAKGNGGEISIVANSLSLTNDSKLSSSTFGQGNAGKITINATEDVSLDTGDIFSNVGSPDISQAEGNAGEITIDANSISLTNEAQIQSGVWEGNLGNGNNVTLNARGGDVTISGGDQGESGIFTDIETIADYDAGNIKIDAQGSIFLNNAGIKSTTVGTGFAGDIKLNAPNEISIKNSEILAEGNFGGIFIGNSIQPSQVTLEGQRTGDSDDPIFSNSLSTTSSNPDDFTGSIIINARDNINIIGTDIQSSTQTTILGRDSENSDGLNFSTIKLKVAEENPIGTININQSRINTSNSSTGYAGDVILNAGEKIETLDSSIFSRGNSGLILIGKSDISGETTSPQEINFDNSFLTVSNKSNDSVAAPETNINAGEISINAINNISFVNNSEISTITKRLGDAGNLTIQSENGSVVLDNSDVFSNVEAGGIGYAGNINITANSIFLINGAQLQSGIKENFDDFLQNESISFGGQITLDAKKNITLSGRSPDEQALPSGIFTDVESTAIGIAGDINITTGSLFLTDKAILTTRSLGFGYAGNITVNANSINLDNNSKIEALNKPLSEDLEASSGFITLKIADDLTLQNNSSISAQATEKIDGGNLDIDAKFIVAYPSNGSGNDLVAAADGKGGTIDLHDAAVFGLEISRNAINDKGEFNLNNENDIDASGGNPNLDGTINIDTSINPVQGATELPSNVVEAEQTTEQACQADRESAAKNGLIVRGKGGIPAPPDQPLTSQNLLINGEVTSAYAIPEPIETSKGKIQLARGIKVTKDGDVILTAYPTNNAGERIPEGRINCGQI